MIFNPTLHGKVYVSMGQDKTVLVLGSANLTNNSANLREMGVVVILPPSLAAARSMTRHLAGGHKSISGSSGGRAR